MLGTRLRAAEAFLLHLQGVGVEDSPVVAAAVVAAAAGKNALLIIKMYDNI